MPKRTIVDALIFSAILFATAGCATVSPQQVDMQPQPAQWNLSPNAQAMYHYLEYQELARAGNPEQAQLALRKAINLDPSPSLYLDLANFHWRRKQLDPTLQALKQGLKQFPDSRPLTVSLVHYYLSQKRLDSAVTTFESYLEERPEDWEVRIELASILIEKERFPEALDILTAIPEEQRSRDTLYLLGKTYGGLGLHKKAISILNKALEEQPYSVELLGELAFLYEMEKDYPAAEQIYSRIADMGEDGEEIWLRQIELNLKLNNPDKAMELVAKGPEEERFLLQVVGLMLDEKFFDQASQVLDQITALPDLSSSVAFYQALLAYEGKDDKEEALGHLERIPAEDRLYDRALSFRSQILFQLNRVDDALSLAREGQQLFPEDASFWILESGILEDKKEFSKARQILRRALEINPDNTDLMFQLGFVEQRMDNEDKALEIMQRIINLDPDNADALNFVGYTLADAGRELERALQLIENALRLQPDSGHIIDSLAWVYFRMGEYEKAWEQIQVAISKVDDDPIVWEHYGDIAKALGLIDLARKGYKNALKREPEDPASIEEKLNSLPTELPPVNSI